MSQPKCHLLRRRRGSAGVYLVVVTPVLFLAMSLAVDAGRVHVAKEELQSAVDAATRAAAEDLARSRSTDSARSSALAVAQANIVDGHPLSLNSQDVIFGTWDNGAKSFTANGSPINAVRISTKCEASRGSGVPTLFAAAAGKTSQAITASATACIVKEIAPFSAGGTVVINHTGNNFSGGSIWATDSFVGADNAYSGGTSRMNGNLLTNGTVQYNFTTPSGAGDGWSNRVSNSTMGTIYTGAGTNCTYTWNNSATGSPWVEYGGWNNPGSSTERAPAGTSFDAPVMPAVDRTPSSSYINSGGGGSLPSLNVTNGATVTLPAGIYNLSSINITNGSRVIFEGPVSLNVADNVTISNASITTAENDARNLKFNLCNTGAAGANTVTISNLGADLYADIIAPKANVAFSQSNAGKTVLGRVKSNNMTLNVTGNGGMHGDESLLGRFFLTR